MTTTSKLKTDNEIGNSHRPLFILVALFSFAVSTFICIYLKFPQLDETERQHIKLPTNIEDAKNLGRVLGKYKEKFSVEVMSTLIFAYIFLQTFAIPGSISLSILAGFLYPFPTALLLICFCSATGASFCYLLSYNFGRRLVAKYFPSQLSSYAAKVKEHQDNLLYYMIFLRITPFFPNWLINLAAPIVEVPFVPFWLGTFIGVAPPSFVAIQAGKTLHQLTSVGGTWSWTSIILLLVFALGSLVPVMLKKKTKAKET